MPTRPKGVAKAKPWERTKAAARNLTPDEQWAEALCERVLLDCHPDQRNFVLDEAKRITALIARGGGKTTAGAARFILRMARTKRARCLYVAGTKTAAREIIWNKLKTIFETLGCECTFAEQALRITMTRTGSELRLHGVDDMGEVDKLRGVPYHEVGIDEAAAIRPAILDALVHRAIEPRLGDYDGSLWMISTPGHTLSGIFYEQTRTGSPTHRPYKERDKYPEPWIGWSSHKWTRFDAAPYVPAIARLVEDSLLIKARNGWSDDNPIWRREHLGEWARDDTNNVYQYRAHVDGQPWNEWDPPREGPLRIAKLPALPGGRNDWLHVLGADMGYSDPFSLHLFSASPSDPERRIYHRYEFEQTKMYMKQIAQLLIGENLDPDKPGGLIGIIGWPTAMVADSKNMEGQLAELANVYGVKFEPADQKDKFASIELMNGDLVDGRMKVLKGSKLAEQMLNLQWAVDANGIIREDKSQANHATDSSIYARRRLAVLFANEAPAERRDILPPRREAPIETDESDPASEHDPEAFDDSTGRGGDFDDFDFAII